MVHIDYSMTPLEDILEIHRIVTIHYYEYKKNFSFGGEAHDFWEFICVDRGDVNITAGENKLTLHKDEIAFHEPMEFHDVCTSPHSAPNLIVVSFECHSPAMDFFRKKVLTIDQEERVLLSSVLREARGCFASRLDDPYKRVHNRCFFSLLLLFSSILNGEHRKKNGNYVPRVPQNPPLSTVQMYSSGRSAVTLPAILMNPCLFTGFVETIS